MNKDLVFFSECPELELVCRGKVRDVYKVSPTALLFVATDRISCFDVIMKTGIKGKGKVLTQISKFWFEYLSVPHHVITCEWSEMPPVVKQYQSQLEGRVMLVHKLSILPVEAIVRGYLSGSGWIEYLKKGTICDIQLPNGLVESEKLIPPLFTPSTKAAAGDHDENIHPSKLLTVMSKDHALAVEKLALDLYSKASAYALSKGLIIADTKFEFGLDLNGHIVLADEVLTPDSSRFWPLEGYQKGQSQPSFDKQYVRDYLLSIKFDKKVGVELPVEVVKNTIDKYSQVCRLLTGKEPVW